MQHVYCKPLVAAYWTPVADHKAAVIGAMINALHATQSTCTLLVHAGARRRDLHVSVTRGR